MGKSIDEVGVAEFKAKATKLLPRVARTGRVLRVLKRGKVLVEVHPPRQARPEPSAHKHVRVFDGRP
jgi:antitoxin (DNA-binding transcriptional repressor) of toxin-antitoxin stability system